MEAPGNTSTSTRSQIGIGTLIVFIAMVLIAAMAASALISTAGFLQTKSEQSSQQSSDQVTNRLQVASKVGNVSSASRLVTVKVYNDSYLNLTGYVGETYDYSESNLLVKEGDIVYIQATEQTSFIYGDLSIAFTLNELDAVKKSKKAQVSFEVLDDGRVRLYDELEDHAVGVVDPPVRLEAGANTFLRYNTKFGQFDYQVGNSSDSDTSYPAGSSYVVNETEEQPRSGPLNVVETVSITVRNGPGSEPVDLENVTIQYIGEEESARLTYGSGDPTKTTFSVTPLKGSETVIEETEQATIEINVTEIGDSQTSLQPGVDAEVVITTQSGAKTRVALAVPETLQGKNQVVF